MLRYLEEVMDAAATGAEPGEQPVTDSPEVDERVAAMADAIRREYPAGLEVIRSAEGRAKAQAAA